MKIISHLYGQVTRQITLDEILPVDRASMPLFTKLIQSRYHFEEVGDSQSAAAQGYISSAFQKGSISRDGVDLPVVAMDFQGQNIQVLCTKTEDAVFVLDDVTKFLSEEADFKIPDREVVDLPNSALIVDFGEKFLSRFREAERLASYLKSSLDAFGFASEFQIQSIKLTGKAQLAAGRDLGVSYVLEERVGRPPGSHWMFSNAPLASDKHVEMLKGLEAGLDGGQNAKAN